MAVGLERAPVISTFQLFSQKHFFNFNLEVLTLFSRWSTIFFLLNMVLILHRSIMILKTNKEARGHWRLGCLASYKERQPWDRCSSCWSCIDPRCPSTSVRIEECVYVLLEESASLWRSDHNEQRGSSHLFPSPTLSLTSARDFITHEWRWWKGDSLWFSYRLKVPQASVTNRHRRSFIVCTQAHTHRAYSFNIWSPALGFIVLAWLSGFLK